MTPVRPGSAAHSAESPASAGAVSGDTEDTATPLTEPRRGRPRSQESYDRVMNATARLLCSTSYDSLTVERIAADAGVGKQTIYRWWKNKADVVLEAILSGYADAEFATVPHTDDLREDLRTWMRAMLAEASSEESVSMTRSLMAAALDGLPHTAEMLAEQTPWNSGSLMKRLRAGVQEGLVRDDLDLTAVTTALSSPVIFDTATGSHRDQAWADALVDMVFRGITTGR